jgi:hypothetical protein
MDCFARSQYSLHCTCLYRRNLPSEPSSNDELTEIPESCQDSETVVRQIFDEMDRVEDDDDE